MIIETNIICDVFSIQSIKVNEVIRLKRDSFLQLFLVKFIYSEKATKFFEIFTLLLSYVVPAKGKVKISQNFVAFSEYLNFNCVLILPTVLCRWAFTIQNKRFVARLFHNSEKTRAENVN